MRIVLKMSGSLCQNLNISRDTYLERAHRQGRFDSTKTRPVIVAFRDFCDVEDIMDSASNLRGSSLGVCRDYPKEIPSLDRLYGETSRTQGK